MAMASGTFAILILGSLLVNAAAFPNFQDLFSINFGESNTKSDGPQTELLSLTTQTGSGFQSTKAYLFGYIAMKLKLVAGDSAGIVTSYYLSSTYTNHCELDFEFLGNKSGQPYALQTNVFVDGVGDREQRITLWFDPSANYHTYGILWNKNLVLFFVDNTAIRVFRNVRTSLGVPYLDYQEMYSFSSIWDGSSWATRGGRDKVNWSLQPFWASYTDFDVEACPVVNGTVSQRNACYREVYRQPYGSPANQTLTTAQWADLKWIQTKWLTYDYCTDKTRWTVQPAECKANWPA